jgi:hypothetical protein
LPRRTLGEGLTIGKKAEMETFLATFREVIA